MIIWLFSTSLVVFIGYVVVMVVYYKAQYEKELKKNDAIKISLEEAEILLRKYQLQLQRSLGSADILIEELTETKDKLKQLNARYIQLRNDNDSNKQLVEELESKIESII